MEPAHPRHALLAATALYLSWALATWFFEGRTGLLLRTDADAERAFYAFAVNILLGLGGGFAVLRLLIRRGGLTAEVAGFGSRVPSVRWLLLAVLLATLCYVLLGPWNVSPVLLLNAWLQVLVVSAAELMVCWALLAGTLQVALGPLGRRASAAGAVMIAAILFGLYHFAHSPPFSSAQTVAMLIPVGVVTGTFFMLSRDAYATVLFHNGLGMIGVVGALEESGQMGPFGVLRPSLVALAMAAAGAFILGHLLVLRRPGAERSR